MQVENAAQVGAQAAWKTYYDPKRHAAGDAELSRIEQCDSSVHPKYLAWNRDHAGVGLSRGRLLLRRHLWRLAISRHFVEQAGGYFPRGRLLARERLQFTDLICRPRASLLRSIFHSNLHLRAEACSAKFVKRKGSASPNSPVNPPHRLIRSRLNSSLSHDCPPRQHDAIEFASLLLLDFIHTRGAVPLQDRCGEPLRSDRQGR